MQDTTEREGSSLQRRQQITAVKKGQKTDGYLIFVSLQETGRCYKLSNVVFNVVVGNKPKDSQLRLGTLASLDLQPTKADTN